MSRRAIPGMQRVPPGVAPLAVLVTVVTVAAGALAGCSSGGHRSSGLPPFPSPAITFPAAYRTPTGWVLQPAGTQVTLPNAPMGVAASPDGSRVFAVTGGLLSEHIVDMDATDLTPTVNGTFTSNFFMGVVPDASGGAWSAGGAFNGVVHYTPSPTAGPSSVAPPMNAATTVPVMDYPGNMVDIGGGWLAAAGTMSAPQSAIDAADPTAGPCPGGRPASDPVCGIVTLFDTDPLPRVTAVTQQALGNPYLSLTVPMSGSAPDGMHIVPVGRDAYGVAADPPARTLFVSNWGDSTNPGRAGGKGTVSVVDYSNPDAAAVVQTIPVGDQPTGIAISPDHRSVAVTNSRDDTVSLLSLDAHGRVSGTRTVTVRITPDVPQGANPMSAGFSPDGRYLFVGLADENAVEVFRSDGTSLPQTVTVPDQGAQVTVHVADTYIPTGWYPWALANAPAPPGGAGSGSRLYVANFKGMGSGPGYYNVISNTIGANTEGSLSAIDIPSDPTSVFTRWTAAVVENDGFAPVLDTSIPWSATDPCVPSVLPGGAQVVSGVLCSGSARLNRALHVVYVLRENHTFDADLGDIGGVLPDANARITDPNCGSGGQCLAYGNPCTPTEPQPCTPNLHALAATYSIGDNLYTNGDESGNGHMWGTAGESTPYQEMIFKTQNALGLRGDRTSGVYGGTTAGNSPVAAALAGLAASASSPGSGGGAGAPDATAPLGNGAFPTSSSSTAGALSDPNSAAVENALEAPDHYLIDNAERAGLSVDAVTPSDLEANGPASRTQPPLTMWGWGNTEWWCPTGGCNDREYPDRDRISLFLTGTTVSHAWGGGATSPPPDFGTPVSLCGTPSTSQCTYAGASPSDYSKFTLAGWEASYARCTASGRNDQSCQSAMPNFTYMGLPEDHRFGTNPLFPTQESMVADNDVATGMLVQGLSQSPFWKDTLVIVSEDDPQQNADHVDIHRDLVLATGGLATRLGPQGKASHQVGSLSSIAKTVEALFGQPALTLGDYTEDPLSSLVGASVTAPAPPSFTAQIIPLPSPLPTSAPPRATVG